MEQHAEACAGGGVMANFPDTPVSLLVRLASDRTGIRDEAGWTRLFELYAPAERGRRAGDFHAARGGASRRPRESRRRCGEVPSVSRYACPQRARKPMAQTHGARRGDESFA